MTRRQSTRAARRSFGVERAERVDDEDWNGVGDVVGDVPGKREYEAHLTLALREVVNRVLTSDAIFFPGDDQIEVAVQPDAFDRLVLEQLDQLVHRLVELRLEALFEVLDAFSERADLVAERLDPFAVPFAVLTSRFEVVDRRFEALDVCLNRV